MTEMKIEDGQPFLRNGNKGWCKPVVDDRGTFFPSQKAACEKFGLTPAQISLAVINGTVTGDGKTFRVARVSEVKAHLGWTRAQLKEVTSKKTATTIEVDGELKPLKREQYVFEGHEFTGGPAIIVLPGTTFRMERPSRTELPAELVALCRWT